jgi:hypothetical protein
MTTGTKWTGALVLIGDCYFTTWCHCWISVPVACSFRAEASPANLGSDILHFWLTEEDECLIYVFVFAGVSRCPVVGEDKVSLWREH